MRRIVLLVMSALLGFVALGLPEPPAPETPAFSLTSVLDDGAAGQGPVWYCPWVSAGAIRDTWLMTAAMAATEIGVTLPSPIPNEVPDGLTASVPGPGAESIEVASIVRRGDAPGFVEFSDGPAAVAAVVTAESADETGALVTGDRCTAAVPKLWHLPGATTQVGRSSVLRLFNPFPEPAKVTVSGTSEFGDVGLLGLSSLDVAGRTWVDIDLNQLVPLLDDLSLTVATEEGLVIPTLVVRSTLDEASWPGTGLSTSWEFPVVTQTGLVPSIVVTNPGDVEAEISIDVYTEDAASLGARTVSIPPGQPIRIPVGDLADGVFAVAVRSSAPVAAVVVASDIVEEVAEEEVEADTGPVSDRIAGTVGVENPANSWLLPGPGTIRTATSTMWILNSGTEPVTAFLVPLGPIELESEEITLAPGTVTRVVLAQSSGVDGYLIEANGPLSAAWSVEVGDGVAFISGTPIDN